MRASNLAAVLGEIHRAGPLTRAALSERTGLTKTTVSKLVADLLAAGYVTESQAASDGERGRPGVLVRLSGERLAALGLEINVDYLAVCVVDLTGTVRLRRTRKVDNRALAPQKALDQLCDLAAEAMAATGELTVAGAALAVPGPVHDGVLVHAPHLGWHDVRPPELLGLPLTVDNEANLAALGELWFGQVGPGFLYVSGEIGIGAGLVVDGALFRGAHGFAGELGHVLIAPGGPPCHCGAHGCLEVYAGQDALLEAAGKPATVEELLALLERGDTRALAACAGAGRALGLALSSAVQLVDPGLIVLGGTLSALFPWLAGPITETLEGRLSGMRRTAPRLTASRLGRDAAILGAAGHVIRRLITSPVAP